MYKSIKELIIKVLSLSLSCMWDNERLHGEGDLPLYAAWRRRQETFDDDASAPSSSSSPPVEPKEVLVMADNQDPEYKALMQQVIAGVQHNDLLQVRPGNFTQPS